MISLSAITLYSPGAPSSERRVLLKDVHLNIRQSEYVALVGPNGAGKSLLLRVLAGLQRPHQGNVSFDSSNGSTPRLGIVFQNPDDQIVGSTVELDLAFGLENQAIPPAEVRRRVDEALEWSGLAAVATRPPHLLSDGEKQKLALTAVLVLEPDLLLLDEPTARLDPPGRKEFLRQLQRARERTGAGVVQVTHRSEEAMECERIVGLEGGRLVFDGTPAELFRSELADSLGILWSPLHRFRRELSAHGVKLADARGRSWNEMDALLSQLVP